MSFSIIAAMDEEQGIGVDGDLAWRLSGDMKHFSQTTKGGAVIMGRNTWESLPQAYQPLPGRLNIVVSRQSDYKVPQGVLLAGSLDDALKLSDLEHTFVIGGATLYAEAIRHPQCMELILTEVEGSFDCDVFFPPIPTHFKIIRSSERFEEGDMGYRMYQYQREASNAPR